MKRQLWRLLDLRDGNGLGFTTELFFLTLRGLSSSSSSPKLEEAFYVGTFKIITSDWGETKESIGTQCILLNLICDLVLKGRGVFSDFPYPGCVVMELLDLIRRIIDGRSGPRLHIDEVVKELQNSKDRDVRDAELRDLALNIIISPPPPPPPPSPVGALVSLHFGPEMLEQVDQDLLYHRLAGQF